MQLSGKTAVIIGGGRGIGRAIALAYAQQGARVVVAARSADEIAETVWLIQEMDRQALAVTTDIRAADQLDLLVQQTLQTFGYPHVVVQSAGIGLRVPLIETDETMWDDVCNTLLKGTYLVSRAFLPGMIEQKAGHLLFIGAPLERIAVPGFAAYCAAKSGIEGLTRVLAKEMRRYGITVNVIHPGGFIETRMVRKTVPEATKGKGLLSTDEITAAAIALAVQGTRGQTGQTIDAHVWYQTRTEKEELP
ncbi:MAG: SDR family oxidoreductase [Chloroflexaceae bacterium]|nr:SDR family oxidoreductase [Chloroflexaceae bacterium]